MPSKSHYYKGCSIPCYTTPQYVQLLCVMCNTSKYIILKWVLVWFNLIDSPSLCLTIILTVKILCGPTGLIVDCLNISDIWRLDTAEYELEAIGGYRWSWSLNFGTWDQGHHILRKRRKSHEKNWDFNHKMIKITEPVGSRYPDTLIYTSLSLR